MPADVDCVNGGDVAWILVSTMLVLTMMPALAFFEAGMLRARNTVSIITQVMTGMAVLSAMWFCFGYSLTFGSDVGNFIGNLDHVLFFGTSYFKCSPHAPFIPSAAFALFFMMFAAITPLLMTGAYAERMTWKGSLLLSIFFELLVFYPIAHQVWGGGWLAQLGVIDFAGGIVIHTTAGAGALVCAIYLGQRVDFDTYDGEFPPSNLPLAALGSALLWAGWFGFNGGSALVAGGVAVSAIVSTQIASSVAAVSWMICNIIRDGHPTSVGVMNGAIAGLAGITPASGYIGTQSSIVVGVVLGLSAFGGVHLIKHKLRIDDALDVSSVHGITGAVGSLALGLLAQTSVNPAGPNGAFFGNARLFGVQLLGVVYAAAWSAAMTAMLLVVMDKIFGGIKHDEPNQMVGLDWVEYREVAYHDLQVLDQHNPVHAMPAFHHSLPESRNYMRSRSPPAARRRSSKEPLMQDADVANDYASLECR